MSTPQKIFMGYTSGKTCWFISFHPDGRVLDAQAQEWVAFVLADLANYFMDYTEINSTGVYVGEYPSGFELDVLPTEASYQQAGATPALPDDLPIISIGQSQGSNVAAIDAVVVAAQNLSKSTQVIASGIVQAGANTVAQIVTDLDGATDDLYRGRVVIFSSGTMNKAAAIIKTFVASTKILGFTDIPTAPSPGDTFIVV